MKIIKFSLRISNILVVFTMFYLVIWQCDCDKCDLDYDIYYTSITLSDSVFIILELKIVNSVKAT